MLLCGILYSTNVTCGSDSSFLRQMLRLTELIDHVKTNVFVKKCGKY